MGSPTRLLDWTYSPLIAAHFAALKILPEADAAVWRFDWQRVHRHFHFPELALTVRTSSPSSPERGRIHPLGPFLQGQAGGAPVCVHAEPPSIDLRIVSQSATFTLCSDTSRSFDEFLKEHGLSDALTKFIIPAADVPALRDQLDLAGSMSGASSRTWTEWPPSFGGITPELISSDLFPGFHSYPEAEPADKRFRSDTSWDFLFLMPESFTG